MGRSRIFYMCAQVHFFLYATALKVGLELCVLVVLVRSCRSFSTS